MIVPATGSNTNIKMTMLPSSTPSKPIIMAPGLASNHIVAIGTGNFAMVAASQGTLSDFSHFTYDI